MKPPRLAAGAIVAAASIVATVFLAAAEPTWLQWSQNPQHTGFLNVQGQPLNRILANTVYDPNVPDEQSLNGGDLLAHYQVPLIDGSDVYMEHKGGTYTKGSYNTQTWGETKFTWAAGALTTVWQASSDWYPPGSQKDFWEPVFHAVVANGSVYMPGFGGSLLRLNTADGTVAARIDPFNLQPMTYVVSPITADGAGNLYYNALRTHDNSTNFYKKDIVDSWLVKVTPANATTVVSYSVLAAGAKSTNDLCESSFSTSMLPWPPSPTSLPGSIPCGTQRVAINIAPAIAPDGTIYSITRAHFISRWGYLVAINRNLTQKWIASLHDQNGVGYFHDGCNDGTGASDGSILPPNGALGGCRADARPGVDPATNRFGGGRVVDDSSSTPTVAPDGSILYGAYSRYNYAQGHLMHFDSSGQFLGAFDFGWDSTPAIYAHDGTYSVVIKNNHYGGLGSYCDDDTSCPPDRTATNPASPEAYFVTQLSPALSIDWTFQNRNTLSCSRQADGSVSCVSDHPFGFEWCVNAPVVDLDGVVYANSEDGNLYAISQGGTLRQNIFQQLALGAAYTPASLGGDGKIYSQNAGRLFVVGQ